jgi:CheY-like chemotaxis protein
MVKPVALIVEDDPGLGEVFSIALKNEFETEIIVEGNAALTRLAQIVPAVVVLDLHLPGSSGKVIFKHIRSDHRLTRTRIILCTADVHEAETLREEVDIVLLKPVSPIQLRQLASRLNEVKED